ATGTCELLLASGLVQETVDLGLLAETSAFGGAAALKLFRHVRRLPMDLFIDFNPTLGTQLFARILLRAKTIAAITPADVIEALTGRSRLGQRARSRYSATLSLLGVSTGELRIDAPLRAEDNNRFERFLKDSGFKGAEPIAFFYSRGGYWRPSKARWSAEMFADLSTRLLNNFGVRTIAADEPGGR